MTPDDVEQRLRKIGEASGDDELAHGMEDELHQDVLRAIADGTIVDGATCARLALKSLDMKFKRWCA